MPLESTLGLGPSYQPLEYLILEVSLDSYRLKQIFSGDCEFRCCTRKAFLLPYIR